MKLKIKNLKGDEFLVPIEVSDCVHFCINLVFRSKEAN